MCTYTHIGVVLLVFLSHLTLCSVHGTEHTNTGTCACAIHKKHVYTCGYTWIIRESKVGNPLAVFALSFLKISLFSLFQLVSLAILLP